MCLASSGVVQCGRRRFWALLMQMRTQNVAQFEARIATREVILQGPSRLALNQDEELYLHDGWRIREQPLHWQ